MKKNKLMLLWLGICMPLIAFSQETDTKTKTIDTIRIGKDIPIVGHIKNYNITKIYTGGSLADAINHTPGIEMVQSGAQISKPIIEGLKNNRILVVADGVKLLGQDWSDQHSIDADVSEFQHIKIIKGAKSVQYGAGALGGVILLEPKKWSYTQKLKGSVGLAGSSNDGRTMLNATLQGSFKNRWAWQVQQSYQRAGDYKTRDYYVNNTGIYQHNTAATLGYRSNGFQSKIALSKLIAQNGVFYGASTGNTDELQDRILLGQPTETLPFSYQIQAPKQNVEHWVLNYTGQIQFNTQHKVELKYHFQKNLRKEFEIRRGDRTSIPTQDLVLESHHLEGAWLYQKPNFSTKMGVQYLNQNNYNKAGTGVAPTIPNYKLHNYGAYIISDFQKNKWKASLGMRYDYRSTNALGYNWLGDLYGGQKSFSNFSYDVVLDYQFNQHWHYLTDLGMAWRSPEPYELYVNGKEHGLPIYYVGNTDLKSERGLKWTNKLEYQIPKFSFGISAFIQPIKNYIYTKPQRQYKQLFSGPAFIFNMVQTQALFRGGDITVKWQPTTILEYNANAALTIANDVITKGYLPMVPPLSTYQEILWYVPNSIMKQFYISLNHRYYAEQHRFDPQQDLTDTPPSAYHLLGLQLGSEFYYHQNKTCFILLKVNNLTNQLYKSYTDHFKYFAHGRGLDIQLKMTINF